VRGFITKPLGQILVAAMIAIGGGGIYVVSTGGGGAPAGTANLWIDSNGGSCIFNSTALAYTGTGDSTSCSSTSTAYTAANTASASASTVAIRAGSYGSQSTPDSTRSGGTIAFRTDNGAVTFADLNVNGDKSSWTASGGSLTLTLGLQTSGPTTRLFGATFDGVIAKGGGLGCPSGCDSAWYMYNAQDMTFKNGEICCGTTTNAVPREGIQVGAGLPTAGTTIDNVDILSNYIHDWERGDSVHAECAFLMGVQNWNIIGNRWANCGVYSISLGRLTSNGDPDPNNVYIANNTFEPSDNTACVGCENANSTIVLDHVTTRYGNLTIINNSLAQNIELHGPNEADVPVNGYDQTIIESNIIDGQSVCSFGGSNPPTWRYNVLDGANCGTGATMVGNANALYVSPSGLWNFHIQSGSAAIGAASQTSGQYTTTDLCGFTRTSLFDAGAYEFGTSC
jgi:hypothetical protein